MDIKINGIYKHYKGNLYRVISFATHTETLEDMVVYEAMYDDNKIWCRHKTMWNDEIEINGQKIKRFELIEDSNE